MKTDAIPCLFLKVFFSFVRLSYVFFLNFLNIFLDIQIPIIEKSFITNACETTTSSINYIEFSSTPKIKTFSRDKFKPKKTQFTNMVKFQSNSPVIFEEIFPENCNKNKFDVNTRIAMFNSGSNLNSIALNSKIQKQKNRRLTGYLMKTTPPGINFLIFHSFTIFVLKSIIKLELKNGSYF